MGPDSGSFSFSKGVESSSSWPSTTSSAGADRDSVLQCISQNMGDSEQ